MSSLQKFHRRTNGGSPPKTIGMESVPAGAGFYLGFAGDGTSYMYVAPKSTEVQRAWGSSGTTRGTVSNTDGLANTNTLVAFGSAAHPAAYYCKNLTTGGYNTWYLPAKDELTTLYSNKDATPFATSNAFITSGTYYFSSTEGDANAAWVRNPSNGAIWTSQTGPNKGYGNYYVRAVRRV